MTLVGDLFHYVTFYNVTYHYTVQLCLPPQKNTPPVSSVPNTTSFMCLHVWLAPFPAQAAVLQVAQKDKEAVERAAAKKISLLEKLAAGKLTKAAEFMSLHLNHVSRLAEAAISQTAAQKDKEAIEKATTKSMSLLRAQVEDGTSAKPPSCALNAYEIRDQRFRSAIGLKES